MSPQLVGFFSVCYHPNAPARVVLDDNSTVAATSLMQGCCISSLCCACVILDILESVRGDFKRFALPARDNGAADVSLDG